MFCQKSALVAVIFVVAVLASATLRADIVFTITGEDSDSIVNWSLSGSVTVNQAMAAQNNDDLLFPTLQLNGWDHLANVSTAGIISSKTVGHASISGSPTISINGGGNLFSGIGLNNVAFTDSGGGDSFQFLFEGLALHPALAPGDTVTYGGSGAINLDAAKNTIFVDGVYLGEQLLHDSARFKLVVQSQAIPEPSMVFGIGVVPAVILLRRRRRAKR